MSDSFNKHLNVRRRSMRPTPKTWFKHSILLLLTLITCTIAGSINPFGRLQILPKLDSLSNDAGFFEVISALPSAYVDMVRNVVWTLYSEPEFLVYGLKFSVSLLFILIAHEAGHYVACRLYRVNATLPYFIPTPPLIGPAGTLGAFIKILSQMPSRRAVFDIGVAGPIAGFIALIPIGILAVATMENAPLLLLPSSPDQFQIVFSDPLMMKILAFFSGIDLSQPIYPNPFYYAAWIGLLVTALNLIPSGQLDGGHAIYAVFGERVHFWTGRIAFVAMAFFSVLGMYFYRSPSGFLFAIILAVMMRIRHPEPLDNTPLDSKRILIAILTLVIFILCFVPIPIQLS